ncbi:hypothetical protein ACFLSG_00480 [Candidatus Bipolaricaulota bacterium]
MTARLTNPWTGEFPTLQGPWLGQGEPGPEPTEFCPAFFSSENRIAGITFSPSGDEAFFALNTPDGGSANLMWTRMIDGTWSRPAPALFNSEQIDNDIVMSPNGERLVWRSWRALPGNTEPEENLSLWATDRTPDGWGEPFPLECNGVRQAPAYTGIAASGTLYFASKLPEGEYGVSRAVGDGKQYARPEIILRGAIPIGDACVAPDESFLIGTCFRLPQYNGTGSLMVSFRTPDGGWSQLQDLGPTINTDLVEYCPTLSADGRRLFFCRINREDRSVPARTFWIDTAVIDELRPTL